MIRFGFISIRCKNDACICHLSNWTNRWYAIYVKQNNGRIKFKCFKAIRHIAERRRRRQRFWLRLLPSKSSIQSAVNVWPCMWALNTICTLYCEWNGIRCWLLNPVFQSMMLYEYHAIILRSFIHWFLHLYLNAYRFYLFSMKISAWHCFISLFVSQYCLNLVSLVLRDWIVLFFLYILV